MNDQDLPSFEGKLVLAYLGEGAGHSVLLQHASFRQEGDRLFLVGRVPDNLSVDWAAGVEGAVAWDSVTLYYLFDSMDHYQKQAARAKLSLRERIARWRSR